MTNLGLDGNESQREIRGSSKNTTGIV